MEVFKFGGASLQNIGGIKNVADILETHKHSHLMIVVSAMGKTTNALEKVAEAFFNGQSQQALDLFEAIKQQHITIAKQLLQTSYNATVQGLADYFTEVEWLLHDTPVKAFDYYYDQVVCIGEILSSHIVSAYLHERGLQNNWLDVRDLLRTDDSFRNANIDWQVTSANIVTSGIMAKAGFYITQGFIGSTDQNESTTLGREGSDFSAAIFANVLQAEKMVIWKDVEGVMNADPRLFATTTLIPALSYNEIIEMAFYGAQVIHPKTIKPLQNKNIALYVKSFLTPRLPGTIVSNNPVKDLPPIIVLKSKQVVIKLRSKDFSFVGGRPMATLYQVLAELNVRANLVQSGAIDLLLCVDDWQEKIDELAIMADHLFEVQIERNLNLLTIRHYSEKVLAELILNKTPVLMQKTTETVQVLYREP